MTLTVASIRAAQLSRIGEYRVTGRCSEWGLFRLRVEEWDDRAKSGYVLQFQRLPKPIGRNRNAVTHVTDPTACNRRA